MKQLQDAYIVAATRTPIGKAPKGAYKNYRPDDLLATIIRAALAQVPNLDPALIEDAVVGCAIPEAQQGLNVARIGALLSGLPTSVGGITVNRFCASGLSAVAMAADRIRRWNPHELPHADHGWHPGPRSSDTRLTRERT